MGYSVVFLVGVLCCYTQLLSVTVLVTFCCSHLFLCCSGVHVSARQTVFDIFIITKDVILCYICNKLAAPISYTGFRTAQQNEQIPMFKLIGLASETSKAYIHFTLHLIATLLYQLHSTSLSSKNIL